MSLTKPVLLGIGLLFLMASFNVANAQIKVYSSEGTTVIGGTARDFDKARSRRKTEDWNRAYAPGEQEREYREAVERERKERQAAAETRAREENKPKEKQFEFRKKG